MGDVYHESIPSVAHRGAAMLRLTNKLPRALSWCMNVPDEKRVMRNGSSASGAFRGALQVIDR